MEQITIKFTVDAIQKTTSQFAVILALYEESKHCILLDECCSSGKYANSIVPARVMDAFTPGTINKIWTYDEIPDDGTVVVLDGNTYCFEITIDGNTKTYKANEHTVNEFPIFRYLASWYRSTLHDLDIYSLVDCEAYYPQTERGDDFFTGPATGYSRPAWQLMARMAESNGDYGDNGFE